MSLEHPNEPGKWTVLERSEGVALWRRDRTDPFPVSMFYLVEPPRQVEVIYGEDKARTSYARRLPVNVTTDA